MAIRVIERRGWIIHAAPAGKVTGINHYGGWLVDANDAQGSLNPMGGLIAATVAGDLAAFKQIAQARHQGILMSAEQSSPLLVTASAVRRVIAAVLDGAAPVDEVARWAGFIRWGDFGMWTVDPAQPRRVSYRPATPAKAVPIHYELASEEAISAAIVRLSESLVDEAPSSRELHDLADSLDRPASDSG